MDFKNYLSEILDGTASDSTIRNRISFLINLSNNFYEVKDLRFLNNTKQVLKELNVYPIHSRYTYLFHIIGAIKADSSAINNTTINFYNNLRDELHLSYNEYRNNTRKNEKQKISLSVELRQRQEQLRELLTEFFIYYDIDPSKKFTKRKLNIIENKSNFVKKFQELLIMACYLFQPALRNDWADLKLTTSLKNLKTNQNYLYIRANKMQLRLNVFKNSAKIGSQNIDIYDELRDLIKLWLSVIKVYAEFQNIEYLLYYYISKYRFYRLEDDDALRRQIPVISSKLLGTKLSINDFRHLWEIAIQRDPNYANLTKAEKIEIHRQLLHSPEIAAMYNVVD